MSLTQVSTGGIKDGQVHTADLADAQITAAKLHADALDRTYTLGASGSNHYTFTGEGLTGAVNDPTLYLTRGKTYRFVNGNSAGAHPFRIQTTVNGSAGTEYNTGVTNNGGAGGSTIIFEVPHDAPDVLYYQCTSHGAMGGIFYITGALADGGVTTAKLADNSVTSAKIENLAVSTAKLANDAVTTVKISDANITTDKIAANAVTGAKIADQAVDLSKLPHGTSSNDGKFLRANNGADPTFETITIPTAFVTGMILLWSGAANAIPTGFVLCDGNNNTPDLRDRFVVGAGNSYAVDATGGSNTATDTANISVSGNIDGRIRTNMTVSNPNLGYHPQNMNYITMATSQYYDTRIYISGVSFSGSDTISIDTRSPYYALCYIMKT